MRLDKHIYRNSVVTLAALLLLLTALAGCMRQGGPQGTKATDALSADRARAGFPRELKDSSGEVLKISTRPSRIVSQTLGTDEILLAICDPSRIIAVSIFARDPKYSPVIEQARAIPHQVTGGAEQILKLNPDLIFVASYSRAETVELLRAAGAPVFRFATFNRIDDIKANIRAVGYAIGEEERAEQLVARMERELEAVKARIPQPHQPPRVLSFSPSGSTAGAGTLFDEMVRAAGAINLAAEKGLTGFPKISVEQLLQWQPDFIVTGGEAGEFDEARLRLLQNPTVAASAAVKAGRIIVIDRRYFLSVSHFITRAIGDLAKGLYGGEQWP